MIDTIGYCAGLLAMISFLPQVVKTLRTKRADDLSMPMLLLTLTANILYVVYGLLLRLYPIVFMIGIMTGIVFLQIILTVKYRNGIPSD
ncbi:MAG: PQ-loop repeat-containing protein [Candidatus Brocadiales bacterium]|nr:PQ-loop repeat-containing protein [Candidatus Brocadiales bacterium]